MAAGRIARRCATDRQGPELNALYPLLATVAAYLIGSLSFAVIVSRAMGLNDPRTYGSGNPGATNVLRSGSKAAAAVTLLLDAAKGWLPVALVQWFGGRFGLGDGTVAMVALAAFLGHLYPVFFRFKGGKGVATAAEISGAAISSAKNTHAWTMLATLSACLMCSTTWHS
jgi:acyl-phosphate glycerol 3-phosphate acyltransferase